MKVIGNIKRTLHDATQRAVEEWQLDKPATLLHLPTGQALLIKGEKIK